MGESSISLDHVVCSVCGRSLVKEAFYQVDFGYICLGCSQQDSHGQLLGISVFGKRVAKNNDL